MADFKYDVCIISDNKEWECKLASDLQETKPSMKCISEKNWIYGKPYLKNLIGAMKQSRKVIVCFSENPENQEALFAAYECVTDMIMKMELDEARLIPVKITANAKIPEGAGIFTPAVGSDDNFLDRLFESLEYVSGHAIETESQLSSPVQCTSLMYIDNETMDFT